MVNPSLSGLHIQPIHQVGVNKVNYIIFFLAISSQSVFSAEFLPLDELIKKCSPGVAPETVKIIIQAESSGKPLAIAVVGDRVKQPKRLVEAILTAQNLESQGKNYSVGLMQINRKNFQRFGLTPATAFETCSNLRAGAAILTECFNRAKVKPEFPHDQAALRGALSCYYSGNFQRGFRLESTSRGQSSYVSRINDKVNAAYRVPAIAPLNEARAVEASSPAVVFPPYLLKTSIYFDDQPTKSLTN
ncbi:lytic transglycosylase domain-containing protein [Chromobacterium amazonense]|nr:lytic transglycosylase domain-containing protein [Chromobacterium amazonense]